MNCISFTVPGQPFPQPRHRVASRGGISRAYIPAKHPVHGYKTRLAMAGLRECRQPMEGALRVEVEFHFQRPKSHWNKSGLKANAPDYPYKCDIDNCFKAATDALNGICYIDDEQICEAIITRQYMDGRDGEGSTAIRISQIGTDRSTD